MKKIYSLFITLVLAIPLSASVEKVAFRGWEEAYRLGNGRTELIVVPAIGRALLFRQISGENAFYWDDSLGGKNQQEGQPYKSFGGLYTWLAPEKHWFAQQNGFQPPLDAVPCRVTAIGPQSLTMVKEDTDRYGLRMELTYQLFVTLPGLKYTVRLVNLNDIPVRWGIWNIASVPPVGEVVFQASPGDLSFEGNRISEGFFLSNLTWRSPFLRMDMRSLQAGGCKMFVRPGSPFILHKTAAQTFLRCFSLPTSADLFTDNHSQIELWFKGGFREVEVLSPEVLILPRQSATWTETFFLFPSIPKTSSQPSGSGL